MSENGLPPHDGGCPPGVTQAQIDRAHEGEEPLWNDLECGGLAAYDCGPPRPPDSREDMMDDLRERATATWRGLCFDPNGPCRDPSSCECISDIEAAIRAAIEAERAELLELLSDAPILVINRAVAELRGDKEALNYADAVARWHPRARAAIRARAESGRRE